MISRIEFYICMCILSGAMIFTICSIGNPSSGQRAGIEVRDSILQVQKDSALAQALKYGLKADSLQAILNRKKLDIKNIQKKYENEKKNVLVLSADSTLSLFERSITH